MATRNKMLNYWQDLNMVKKKTKKHKNKKEYYSISYNCFPATQCSSMLAKVIVMLVIIVGLAAPNNDLNSKEIE